MTAGAAEEAAAEEGIATREGAEPRDDAAAARDSAAMGGAASAFWGDAAAAPRGDAAAAADEAATTTDSVGDVTATGGAAAAMSGGHAEAGGWSSGESIALPHSDRDEGATISPRAEGDGGGGDVSRLTPPESKLSLPSPHASREGRASDFVRFSGGTWFVASERYAASSGAMGIACAGSRCVRKVPARMRSGISSSADASITTPARTNNDASFSFTVLNALSAAFPHVWMSTSISK